MSQFSLVLAIACSFLVSNVCSQLQEQSEGSAPPPSFLRGAPQELINEFHKLLRESNSKTDKQIDEAIDAWINGQTPEIKVGKRKKQPITKEKNLLSEKICRIQGGYEETIA